MEDHLSCIWAHYLVFSLLFYIWGLFLKVKMKLKGSNLYNWPKQLKKLDKIHEALVFLETGHQAAQDSDFWDRENKAWPIYCLKLLPTESWQVVVWKGKSKRSLVILLRWENRSWILRKLRQLQFLGKDRERNTEDLWRAAFSNR